MIRTLLAVAVAGFLAADPLEARFGPSWIDGPESKGETLAIRGPAEDLFTNIGSHVDGLGMCVNTSIESQARWLGMDQWRGFRDWSAAAEGGGSYPTKVDRQIAAWARKKGLPPARYIQYEGPDPGPVLALCAKTRRGCAIAYGYSPRYGEAINHMVFCPQPRGSRYSAVADNNVFGGLTRDEAKRYEWMSNDELVNRMKTAAGRFGQAVSSEAWVFCWTEPPPAPSPKLFPPS